MSDSSPDRARVVRSAVPLATAVVLLGIADSMVGTYLVLFASEHAHLGPVQIGLFVSAPGVGGLVLSTLAGRGFDRRPTRAWAIGCAVVCAAGFVLLTTTDRFVLLLLVAATFLAALQPVFPQLFALARVVLGEGPAGQRSAPLLRSGWSLAWAVGPLAGAVLVAHVGYLGLLWSAAGVLLLVVLGVTAVPAPPAREDAATQASRQPDATPRLRPVALALLVGSVAAFFLSTFAGAVVLPLYVTDGLGEPGSTVGLLFSACAWFEVLATLGLAALPTRTSQRALLVGGMLALVAYFAVVVLADGLVWLVVAQLARGIAFAVVGAGGIRFFQDLLHPATGRATTLFANATTAGGLLSGLLAGAAIAQWGYVVALLLCGGLAVLATAGFTVATSARLTPARPLVGPGS